jgi:PAS domain S-box-containing protein
MTSAVDPWIAQAFDRFPDGVSIFEAIRDGGEVTDFLCVYGNAATSRLSGVPVDGLVGHTLLEVVPAFRDAGPFDGYRQALETGEPWELEFDFDGRVGDGRVRSRFEMRAVRFGDGVIVTYRDVATLRRAEDAIERMAAIVESTDDAVVGADDTGRITHWNPGAERLLGHRRDEIVGRALSELVRPDDRFGQADRFAEILAGRRVVRIETQWVRRDRTLVDVRITASPLRDRTGRIVGASAVVHDITEHKRIEAELRRSNAELERFAAVAAHDLRTPLVTLKHLARLLEPSIAADDERGRELLHHVLDATTHACRLVDGLAEYAQTAGGVRAHGPVELDVLLQELLATHAPAIEEAGARVEAWPLPTVIGDAGGLARVLQNLLANALKYHGDGPPAIEVYAERARGAWTITVRDEGPGVAAGQRARIFEIFTRGRNDDAVPGSGLGLAVCQTIVEHHGGRIWVDPAAGGGSAFRFTLPERLLDARPA